MDKYAFEKYVIELIDSTTNDLRELQLKIEDEQTFLAEYLFLYVKSCLQFCLLLTISLNYFDDDTRFDYLIFQNARLNFERTIYYSEMISEILLSLDNSIRLEEITRRDYSELIMVKEDQFSIGQFSTHMRRATARFNELFEGHDED